MKVVEGGKDPSKKEALHVTIALALLATARANETPYLNTVNACGEARTYQYFDGIWGEVSSLQTLIAKQMLSMGLDSTAKMRMEVEKWIRCFPEISNWDLTFDGHGMIACANGLLDPHTMELRPYTPDDLATRKGAAEFIPGAVSPLFDRFLKDCLSDRNEDECASIIDLLQEWFGAGLAVHLLTREGRKAMLLVGPSRTGKTELSNIFRKLIGGESGSPSVEELSDKFGMQSLYGVQSWVRDDAINEGDNLDPQKFKVVVTGEITSVNRKNQAPVQHSFCIPVFLTTNTLPDAKDSSDAIFNRSIIIDFTRVVSEQEATIKRRQLKVPAGLSISDHIFAQESAGILNWAILGLDRLLQRGYFELPERVKNAIRGFKDRNNPVAEWVSSAAVFDPSYRVARKDLLCAFHGWQRETEGDNARAMGGKRFFPSLRDAMPGVTDSKSGERFMNGVRLTDAGLAWWDQHNQEPLKSGTKGSAGAVTLVNQSVVGHKQTGPDRF